MDSHDPVRWRVDRLVPLSVILFALMHTLGGVWFAASYVARNDSIQVMVMEMRGSMYSKEDALRDKDLQRVKMDEITRRLTEIEQAQRGKR